jgi:predicted Zn-ribbon and HTH transcriptional regulator
MSTVTIYARVPEELKQATDNYASEHGMTLASAVTDLLGRGLEAAASEDSIQALEDNVQELQRELAKVRPAIETANERLTQILAECQCGHSLSGHDLLISGKCPKCSKGVAGVLTDSDNTAASVNRSEMAPFMAGVGVALAVILLAYAANN